MRVLCALALVVAVAGLPLAARAEVVVTECATIETPVDVQDGTSFTVTLQRDPVSAASARLDLVAEDPDNFGGIEVGARIEPTGDTLPDFAGFNANDYNDRRYSFSGTIPTAALITGENTLVFEDFDGQSPFLLERLCLTLVDAPLPAPRPITEVFCAQGVVGPSPFDNGGEQAVALPGTLTFDIDVPISAEAEVALDLVVNVADNQGGQRTITLTRGEEVLSGTFDADDNPNTHRIRTALEPSQLLTSGLNEIAVEGDFSGEVALACLIVRDEGPPPEPDAGPSPDAGPVLDEGPSPGDAGSAPPNPGTDAGGDPNPVEDDAGSFTPSEDAGPSPRPDGGTGDDAGVPPDEQPPGDEDLRDQVRAELTSDRFSVQSGCAASGAPLPVVLLLLVAMRRRRGEP